MKKFKDYFLVFLIFLCIEMLLCFTILFFQRTLAKPIDFSTSAPIHQINISYPKEKRGVPTYDKIMGNDGWPHYRVFFWTPKTATHFVPYADAGVRTDVSSHGPVEKWSVVETQTIKDDEKLVFVFVPKTFVFLYGKGFEKVIHLSYS
ncbi:hypothetical protein [Clostridium sp. DJ247]|uniref:hypothetical protein n=1 Tax=Clostridium sp. DJ247 TaxID=2726188 RepID=UPI0016256D94|nr:hypothetical protein [Clostridium sp. DJ247]MBC2581959.1 hypothetical protein [Clostridium sp. DJ247]